MAGGYLLVRTQGHGVALGSGSPDGDGQLTVDYFVSDVGRLCSEGLKCLHLQTKAHSVCIGFLRSELELANFSSFQIERFAQCQKSDLSNCRTIVIDGFFALVS